MEVEGLHVDASDLDPFECGAFNLVTAHYVPIPRVGWRLWLVDVMRNGDWKPRDDGMVEFHAVVPDRSDTREAVVALARALGLELDEGPAES